MNDVKRSILDRVVQGTITPDEAAAELEQLESESAPRANPVSPSDAEGFPASSRHSDLVGVRIINQMGSVVVIGDAGVQDVVAEGPHRARREGSTMVIEAEPPFGHQGFRFGRAGSRDDESVRRLVIRMNPGLLLEAEVQAGSLKVHNLTAAIRAVVMAGSTVVDDCSGPYDVSVSAGSFKARTLLTGGDSTIRCEAGSVKIHLLAGSSCRVRARTTMGKITLPGGHRSQAGFGDSDEVTIGSGAANLDIQATVGSVQVSSDQ